jgi:hypothetical protein
MESEGVDATSEIGKGRLWEVELLDTVIFPEGQFLTWFGLISHVIDDRGSCCEWS